MKGLFDLSNIYYNDNRYYEIFSQAEDHPKYVEKFLIEVCQNKIVLDAGCGSGKYLSQIEKIAKALYGVDLSQKQLDIAKTKISTNTLLTQGNLKSLPYDSEMFDVIYVPWVLGTILDMNDRQLAINELKRVIKSNGKIYLIENNVGGEFEIIRNNFPNSNKTKNYNDWLISQGFEIKCEYESYFKFNSSNEADNIFNKIYGDRKAKKICENKIQHNIIIFQNIGNSHTKK